MGYIAFWASFCLLAVGILLKEWKHLSSEWRDYLRFLCVPWKLVIFVPAFLFVTFAGQFTDDETWDIVTGSGTHYFAKSQRVSDNFSFASMAARAIGAITSTDEWIEVGTSLCGLGIRFRTL